MLDFVGATYGGSVSATGFFHSYLKLFFYAQTLLYNILILQESSGVNFLFCFLMMLLDTLLYCAIGLYLDKVWLIS